MGCSNNETARVQPPPPLPGLYGSVTGCAVYQRAWDGASSESRAAQ